MNKSTIANRIRQPSAAIMCRLIIMCRSRNIKSMLYDFTLDHNNNMMEHMQVKITTHYATNTKRELTNGTISSVCNVFVVFVITLFVLKYCSHEIALIIKFSSF
jgi:hypothetical protein